MLGQYIHLLHAIHVIEDSFEGLNVTGIQRRQIANKNALQLRLTWIGNAHLILQQTRDDHVLQLGLDVVESELLHDLHFERTEAVQLIMSHVNHLHIFENGTHRRCVDVLVAVKVVRIHRQTPLCLRTHPR